MYAQNETNEANQTGTPTPDKKLPLTPRGVKSWLDTLSLTDLDATATAILHALGGLKNNHRLSAKQRFRVLEALSPFLSMLLPSLATRYSGKPLPLAQHDRETVELSTALQLELIHGYQQVLTDSSRVYLFGWRKLVTTTIHRLFRYRSNILCNYRLCYLPYPPGVWKQIYWFYQLVEENGLSDKRVCDPLFRRKKTSIEFEFKRLLLLSLLSPHHFAGSSIDEVYEHLDIWVSRAGIIRPNDTSESGNAYCFDLNSDLPPQMNLVPGTKLKSICCLDTSALVRELRRYLDNNEPDTAVLNTTKGLKLSRSTLKKLLLGWNRADYRRADRLHTQEKVDICIGIESIHNTLALSHSGKHTDSLIDSRLSAYLLDFSNQGFCLSISEKECERLQLDDLVALKTLKNKQWRMGQVKWMQSNGRGRVRLGVMLLSSRILPGQAMTKDVTSRVTCVLGLNQPHPVLYFSAESRVTSSEVTSLRNTERETPVTLHERFVSSTEFDAYYFAFTNVPDQNLIGHLERRRNIDA